MSIQSSSPAARLVRSVFHGRNPLTRASDRVESAVFVIAVPAALLGVPVVAAHDLKAGSAVPVWIDESAATTTPPLTSEGAVITAVEPGWSRRTRWTTRERRGEVAEATVGSVMTDQMTTPVEEIVRIPAEHRFGAVPVIDDVGLVGVPTRGHLPRLPARSRHGVV